MESSSRPSQPCTTRARFIPPQPRLDKVSKWLTQKLKDFHEEAAQTGRENAADHAVRLGRVGKWP